MSEIDKQLQDAVKRQKKDLQEKLDNLGHALDGEDISHTEFEVKASKDSYILMFAIVGMIFFGTFRITFKDAVKALMGMNYNSGALIIGAGFIVFMILFMTICLVIFRKKRIYVKGSELIYKNKVYHCSDITSAKLGTMSTLTLRHAEKKIVTVSLGEYDNADKLAAWLERCNIPVERNEKANARSDATVKVIALLVAIMISIVIIKLSKIL